MNFKKIRLIIGVLFCSLILPAMLYSQDVNELLLDDFEGEIAGGEQGTVDYGSGNGSIVEVKGSKEIKYHGEQALAVTFEAVSGGYMWIARGYELTVKGAGAWLVEPKDIDFTKYNAISFYMYGANTKNQVAVDIVDSGSEYWRYLVEDNFSGWKEVVIPFNDFFPGATGSRIRRIKTASLISRPGFFQFEPRPEGKGAIYFDYVRLVKK